jgi:type II secretory pathway pseudopilin PulG
MRASVRLQLAVVAVAAVACSPRLLPGTDIREDRDTRAVYDVLRTYQDALQRRDAQAVLGLVAPDYFDAGGTPDPEDDVDRSLLAQRLPADLQNVDTVKLDLTIRKIEVQKDRAVAEVFYDGWYRVKTPRGVVPRRDSDIHQMRLRKVEGQWLVSGGL